MIVDSLRRRVRYRTSLIFVPLLLMGCTRAPSVDILGSFFPSWLVCLVFAILLTVGVRFAVVKLNVKVAYPVLVYLGLVAFFTFALWLIFFY